MRALKPQRFTLLTPDEEKQRCHQTWRAFDKIMWMVGFGTEQDLYKHVVKPAEFIAHRKDTVLIAADQIPFYAKIGSRESLFAT